MLPVARRPMTFQLSISVTFSTGSTKMRGSPVPSMIPSVWMCVPCLMPDAKLHDPLKQESAVVRHRVAGPRALSGDHGQPSAVRRETVP